MRGIYAEQFQRRRRLHRNPLHLRHPVCACSVVVCGDSASSPFGTIKKPTQADDAAHVSSSLPLAAKFQLHDKHDQRDKDMQRIPVELEREEKSTSHRSTFPAPNVSALGAYCVKRSRTRESRSALPSAINVIRQIEALPVYTEVACA